MALAIIGGMPERFAPFVQLYRDAARRAGHDPATLPISINAHGFVADDPEEAAELAWPPFAATMGRIGRERGWPPPTRSSFDGEATLRGALFLGGAQEIVEKILFHWEIFRHDRFLIQLTVGPMPHDKVLRAIEILGTEVAPTVREEIARRKASSRPVGDGDHEAPRERASADT
jgi:alkanesulfonate monooxygenase SsuD/methylene tetrahydromethanopterin reductase-like flavin-dependent oxidoreductase (luciferase family)